MAKFAEDEKIEQMNAQKRRMRQLEHKRAAEEILQQRRTQYAKDRVRINHIHYCILLFFILCLSNYKIG